MRKKMDTSENFKYRWIKLPDVLAPLNYECEHCGHKVVNKYVQCPWCKVIMLNNQQE